MMFCRQFSLRLSSPLICGLIVGVVCWSIQVTNCAHHHGGGHSNIYREQNGWGKYSFGYDIHDPWGNKNFRKERGEFTKKGGHVVGSYGIYDAKGRLRLVKYTAGKHGFVATIKTNEPGTGNEDSAGVFFNGGDHHKGKWLFDVGTHHHGYHGHGHHDHHGHHGHHDRHDHHGHHGHHGHHKIGHHGKYIAAASEPKGLSGSSRQQRKYDDKGFPLDGEHGNGHPSGPVNANGFDQRGFRVSDFSGPPKHHHHQRGFGRDKDDDKHSFSSKNGFDRDPFQSNFGEGKLGFKDDKDDGEYRRLASNYPRAEEGHKYSKSSFD